MSKESIAKEYQSFWEVANSLAEKEVKEDPKGGSKEDRRTKHILGMIEMYTSTYQEEGTDE